MSGDRCVEHDNWHAHCQRCCSDENDALRAELAATKTELDKAIAWLDRSWARSRIDLNAGPLEVQLAATKAREARLREYARHIETIRETPLTFTPLADRIVSLKADLATAAAVTADQARRITALEALHAANDETIGKLQALVPTDDQVVLLKADYERLIKSLPTVLVSVPK